MVYCRIRKVIADREIYTNWRGLPLGRSRKAVDRGAAKRSAAGGCRHPKSAPQGERLSNAKCSELHLCGKGDMILLTIHLIERRELEWAMAL